ncbi:MAG: hypothetical protein QGH20_10495 [Candidatus Latescibacteria bacterium]|jgi:hypothetical protein|nr:hypothetical protein [Candidatus Latescibacterota bacterium]
MAEMLTDAPHLFVDLEEVDRRENVTRIFHSADKFGRHPVLSQTKPWEKHPGMTASVVFDDEEGVF